MADEKVMILGEKESFLIRILLKKTAEAGIDCAYVRMTVDAINAEIEKYGLVTIYMDSDKTPGDDVLHFLYEKLIDEGKQVILIGEEAELDNVEGRLTDRLIYRSFTRPVDAEGYISAVKEVFKKAQSGEFYKRILIVDDDPTYMGLVREWLKGSYSVSMANSGLQALKWLGKNKADLILLDYEMPVTSGPQVLEMLRSDDETKNIPVIFLTGKGDRESVMAVVSLKPEGYFLKNIGKEELLGNLKDFFEKHK